MKKSDEKSIFSYLFAAGVGKLKYWATLCDLNRHHGSVYCFKFSLKKAPLIKDTLSVDHDLTQNKIEIWYIFMGLFFRPKTDIHFLRQIFLCGEKISTPYNYLCEFSQDAFFDRFFFQCETFTSRGCIPSTTDNPSIYLPPRCLSRSQCQKIRFQSFVPQMYILY